MTFTGFLCLTHDQTITFLFSWTDVGAILLRDMILTPTEDYVLNCLYHDTNFPANECQSCLPREMAVALRLWLQLRYHIPILPVSVSMARLEQ